MREVTRKDRNSNEYVRGNLQSKDDPNGRENQHVAWNS